MTRIRRARQSRVMVFGQMNEPPGARLRVGLTGADDGRVFPRRGPRRAAVHRQHLPLHPGGLRSVRAAGPYAVARSATSRRWPTRWASCRSASRRPRRLDHLAAGGLRARRRLHRSRRRPRRSPTWTRRSAWSARSPSAASIPAVDPLASTSPHLDPQHRRRRALRHRARGAARAAAVQGPAGHHRHPGHRRAERGRQADRGPRPRLERSCHSRCSSPRRSRAWPASTCRSPRRCAA